MKQLISATLSEEAAIIYNAWEKQKKSARLSELIVKENSNHNQIKALQTQKSYNQRLMSNAMIALHLKDPQHPLCKQLNEALEGTIYYQYWD
jgi:ATP sulfurylase